MLESSAAQNESALNYAMRQVDEGIRDFEEEFKSIGNKNKLKGGGILSGVSSVVLCMFAPPEITEYIRAIIGGATGVGAFNYLANRTESKEKIRRSNFYFPWLIAKS